MGQVCNVVEPHQSCMRNDLDQRLMDGLNVIDIEPADHHQSGCRDLAEPRPRRRHLCLLAWALCPQRLAVHVEEELARWPANPAFICSRSIQPHPRIEAVDLIDLTRSLGRLDHGVELSRKSLHVIRVRRATYCSTNQY